MPARLALSQRGALPLPKGEGRGEGERDARLGKGLRQIPRRSRIRQRVWDSEALSLALTLNTKSSPCGETEEILEKQPFPTRCPGLEMALG
jgi:hypothetical protein